MLFLLSFSLIRFFSTIRMEIYILRHEKRGHDQTFGSRLKDVGRENAEALAGKLDKTGIKTIICSPFLRTLETIAPFAKKSGIEVCLEWGVVEFLSSRQHADLPDAVPYPSETFGCTISKEYKSVVPSTAIRRPERTRHLKERLAHFVNYLYTADLPSPILVCTHMHVCNALIQISNPEHEIKSSFPSGHFVKIKV